MRRSTQWQQAAVYSRADVIQGIAGRTAAVQRRRQEVFIRDKAGALLDAATGKLPQALRRPT